MSIIPNIKEKNCFVPCDQLTVNSGRCDCYNRLQNVKFNAFTLISMNRQRKIKTILNKI